jgi:hypothetical protein
MTATNTSYCTYRDTHVNTADDMKLCIMEHQCFSDDACPLHDEFNLQVLNATKLADPIAALDCAPPPTKHERQKAWSSICGRSLRKAT